MCRVDIGISREPQLRHTQADAYTRTSRKFISGQKWASGGGGDCGLRYSKKGRTMQVSGSRSGTSVTTNAAWWGHHSNIQV